MALRQALASGKFVVTGEIGPPKGVNLDEVFHHAEYYRNSVDAVNVTESQSAVMRVGSLSICHLLKERGFDPVYQIVCRDRNRIALQSDLLSAYVLGIENVLVLTGDYPSLGDHPDAKPVFDIDSTQLLQAAVRLQEGYDMAGKQLYGSPKFFLGAVVSPAATPLEPQLLTMERKVKAGAQFFQTQGIFDADKFAYFMEQVKHLQVPILAGIILLKSAGMARFMNKNVAGVQVPEALIKELEAAKDKAEASIRIATRLINELKGLCQGVHIMPLGWEDKVPKILEGAGLLHSGGRGAEVEG